MAKAKQPLSSSCKTTSKRKIKSDSLLGHDDHYYFSESEIDAAEQLIQLSSDSDSNNNNTKDNSHDDEIISDCDTTHVLIFNKIDDGDDIDDRGDQIPCGSKPVTRKIKSKRFKSLSDIYSLTKPVSFDNHHR